MGETPVGVAEVAERLNVDPRTVHQWKNRRKWGANDPVRAAAGRGGSLVPLPDYDWPSVNGVGAWRWRTILRWAGLTGRLGTDELVAEYRGMFKEDPRPARVAGRLAAGEVEAARKKVNGSGRRRKAVAS